jgi:2-hydroxy-3-oxopropionate reductase
MARNLLAAGHPLVVHSRSPGPVEELVAAGAERASGPREVGERAGVVILMLPDSPAVEAVALGEDGVLAGASEGDLLIDMSTIHPTVAVEVARTGAGRGVGVLDAPVSGGDVGAEQATLSIMVGGGPGDVARVRPLLEAMGTTVDHLGPLGAGQLAKACNQIVVAATLTALSEALVLARKGGLDAERVFAVLGGGLAASRVLEVKGPKLLGGDFRPGGAAAFQHKDLGFALAAARAEGVALPLTALVDQLYGAARWSGFGDDDHSVVVRIIERLAGEPR